MVSIAVTNMHMFYPNCRNNRYATTGEILSDFCPLLMETDGKRRGIILGIEMEVLMIGEKVRFIQMIKAVELKLDLQLKAHPVNELQRHKFVQLKGWENE